MSGSGSPLQCVEQPSIPRGLSEGAGLPSRGTTKRLLSFSRPARRERRDDEPMRTGAQRQQHRVVERKEAPLARHHHRLDRLTPAAAEGTAAAGHATSERGERQAEQLTQSAEAAAERAGSGGEEVDGRGYAPQ